MKGKTTKEELTSHIIIYKFQKKKLNEKKTITKFNDEHYEQPR